MEASIQNDRVSLEFLKKCPFNCTPTPLFIDEDMLNILRRPKTKVSRPICGNLESTEPGIPSTLGRSTNADPQWPIGGHRAIDSKRTLTGLRVTRGGSWSKVALASSLRYWSHVQANPLVVHRPHVPNHFWPNETNFPLWPSDEWLVHFDRTTRADHDFLTEPPTPGHMRWTML